MTLAQAPQHALGAGLAQASVEHADRQAQQDQANEDEQYRFQHAEALSTRRGKRRLAAQFVAGGVDRLAHKTETVASVEPEQRVGDIHVFTYADHLHHLADAAAAIGHARQLDHHVQCGADHLPQGAFGNGPARQPYQRLQTQQRILGIVGVHGAHRTVVAGVHRRQHVEHFHAPYFAEDDPVRTHPQGVADQVAGLHFAVPFGIWRTGFQAHHVRVAELQFGDVFDGHQPFVRVDQLAENVQQRGFAGAGAAADQNVAALVHGFLDEIEDRLIDGLHRHQVSAFKHVLAKLSNRQAWAVEGDRRNDRIDPAAIGQACIDHRRRLIKPSAQGREDPLHDPFDVVGVDETKVTLMQHTFAFDEHPVRAVDQDLGHCRVAQQHFQRAETCEFVDDFFGQALHFIAGNRQVQTGDVLGHFVDDELRQHLPRTFQQVFSGLFDGVDDVAVQYLFQAFVVGVAGRRALRGAEQFFTAHCAPLKPVEPAGLGFGQAFGAFGQAFAEGAQALGQAFARGQFEQAHALVFCV